MVTEEERKGHFNIEGWLGDPVFHSFVSQAHTSSSLHTQGPLGIQDLECHFRQTGAFASLSPELSPKFTFLFVKKRHVLHPLGLCSFSMRFCFPKAVGGCNGLDLSGRCCCSRSAAMPGPDLLPGCTTIPNSERAEGRGFLEDFMLKETSNSTKILCR